MHVFSGGPWSGRFAMVGLVVAAVSATIVGQLVSGERPGSSIALSAAVAVSFAVLGVLVLEGAPGHPVGRCMVAAGVVAAAAVVAASWHGWTPLAWFGKWAWWPPFGLIFFSLLLFPDGRLPGRRWRPLAVLTATTTLVGTVALAVAALDHPRTLLTLGVQLTPRAHVLMAVARVAIVVTVLCLPAVLVSLWLRWRSAEGDIRPQVACLLPAGIVLALGLVLDGTGLAGGWVIVAVALPLGMAVAILRYRLYDIDLFVNRTIVWLVMTLLVVVSFVAIVAILRDAVMRGRTADASLVATGLIAVTFTPLHQRVQRTVDHLLYGERDDPYKVIRRLGDLLGRTVEPDAVLPLLTGTIARSLQVPYVAVELDGPDGPRLFAAAGREVNPVESFEMVAHGEHVGRLLVATRSGGSRFTPRERRLLQDVALHAAVAAEATRLSRELQDSRERLVVAREEERRRLRRDLHDGLGPSLAGMAMQARAARRLLTPPSRAADILDAIAGDLQTCTAEVRRLVDELRPPALDGGLEVALRGECARFDGATLSVDLLFHGRLDELPAAVEVAVYRFVGEALTNVARHSGARRCRVIVRPGVHLVVEVIDDGEGIASKPGPHRGVGLASMRERAAELGGAVTIEPTEPRGTRVRFELPVARPAVRGTAPEPARRAE